MKRAACFIFITGFFWMQAIAINTNFYSFLYQPAPPGNPLKGFLPYAGSYSSFPYSMEYGYLPLRAVMTGPTNFDWTGVERLLTGIAQRGHQAVFRVYLDYPGKPTGLPQYLLDAGLATHSYDDFDNGGVSVSPDYENPQLRLALKSFIAAFGARYDGDPRLGFIEIGLLGFWGEWHTYPHTEWFASSSVQNEVLTAFEKSFAVTRLLVRRPIDLATASRRVGYHDDSFAFETLEPPDWTFLGLLKVAGETNKWRTQPIGGEIRPEIQRCMWDANNSNCVPPGQEYLACVEKTHASWMLNQGAFLPGLIGPEKSSALAGAQRLGYELYASSATVAAGNPTAPLNVQLQIRNTGVAPFYYDWPVQLRWLDSHRATVCTWVTDWKLSSLLPSETNAIWSYAQTRPGLAPGSYTLMLGVKNPLTNGVPLRFANETQDANEPGWLTIGKVAITPAQQ
jgi:Domain of unknown function (DUF4832)